VAITGIIAQTLEEDRNRSRKHSHTAKRTCERLRDEHGFTGSCTIVKDYVREQRRRSQEMFVPLAHAAGDTQADLREALAITARQERKIHLPVFLLPHSEAVILKA
jgi:transposase